MGIRTKFSSMGGRGDSSRLKGYKVNYDGTYEFLGNVNSYYFNFSGDKFYSESCYVLNGSTTANYFKDRTDLKSITTTSSVTVQTAITKSGSIFKINNVQLLGDNITTRSSNGTTINDYTQNNNYYPCGYLAPYTDGSNIYAFGVTGGRGTIYNKLAGTVSGGGITKIEGFFSLSNSIGSSYNKAPLLLIKNGDLGYITTGVSTYTLVGSFTKINNPSNYKWLDIKPTVDEPGQATSYYLALDESRALFVVKGVNNNMSLVSTTPLSYNVAKIYTGGCYLTDTGKLYVVSTGSSPSAQAKLSRYSFSSIGRVYYSSIGSDYGFYIVSTTLDGKVLLLNYNYRSVLKTITLPHKAIDCTGDVYKSSGSTATWQSRNVIICED